VRDLILIRLGFYYSSCYLNYCSVILFHVNDMGVELSPLVETWNSAFILSYYQAMLETNNRSICIVTSACTQTKMFWK
jgi:hypothetical protein